ncbi:hypothetical protein BJX63DRAFT_403361 [Aspergillus granulosus]|uniref:Uncharacterized protein n=1 Tax=Aspergillus granulosus TaxID=176169 RepID=A0ABR4H3L1_9EURO
MLRDLSTDMFSFSYSSRPLRRSTLASPFGPALLTDLPKTTSDLILSRHLLFFPESLCSTLSPSAFSTPSSNCPATLDIPYIPIPSTSERP